MSNNDEVKKWITDYLRCVEVSWSFPEGTNEVAAAGLGLGGEVGEILNAMMKCVRGDFPEEEFQPGGSRHEWLIGELGGVFWFWAALCMKAGVRPEDVILANKQKIYDRLNRGVIKGDGDNR
jgi:NTP pyrophosphatase (non-canonical NTP hydrolase)